MNNQPDTDMVERVAAVILAASTLDKMKTVSLPSARVLAQAAINAIAPVMEWRDMDDNPPKDGKIQKLEKELALKDR